MAKSIQLACCGYQITQENAVLVFYALAGRNDDIVAVFFQLGYFFQEHILVKGALRQQNDVRAVAVSPGSQAGGTGQPAGMAAHDLGHRYAADVIHAGITDDLFQDGGNVLGGTAVTGGVVGVHQVVVNGFGHADKADLAALGSPVSGKLGNGVHRIIAANVEHGPNAVLGKQLKQLHKGAFVRGGVGQLEPAAAQVTGRRALEQLNFHLVVKAVIQVHNFALQKPLNAILHAVYMGGAQSFGSFIHTGQAGIDHSSRPAGLADQYICSPRHKKALLIFAAIMLS